MTPRSLPNAHRRIERTHREGHFPVLAAPEQPTTVPRRRRLGVGGAAGPEGRPCSRLSARSRTSSSVTRPRSPAPSAGNGRGDTAVIVQIAALSYVLQHCCQLCYAKTCINPTWNCLMNCPTDEFHGFNTQIKTFSLIYDSEYSVQEQALSLNASSVGVYTQGMIVLNNIAAGSESGKDGVMNYLLLPREDSNIPPLAPKFLHGKEDWLLFWCSVNLTFPVSAGLSRRVASFQEAGMMFQLKFMLNDPYLDCKLRFV
ncbi:hypothetical protein OPV22_012534 [Ensete ventricosum]|uniref:Uncharacterized protein n=1 Tax=Ensete ventricosum TaxID=4639 RepID=A0AAV8R597_ENSVE|nr:hypothetical protein OPV22_012534 [Ensete ventricosum]